MTAGIKLKSLLFEKFSAGFRHYWIVGMTAAAFNSL